MKSEKILVVEDDEYIQQLVGYSLKKKGYQIYNANDGYEALEMINKILPDMIIIDIIMLIISFGNNNVSL